MSSRSMGEDRYQTVDPADGKKLVGRPVRRVEDARLLSGLGRYVDDLKVADALHMALRRSDQAHARVVRVDATAARKIPGVYGVYGWQDIEGVVKPVVASSRMADYQPTRNYPLANGTVCHVGEPIVAVLAASRYIAEDAADALDVVLEPLPAANDPRQAVLPDAPKLHEDLVSNVLVQRRFARGEVDAAFAEAAHRVSASLRFHRKTPVAMENRCCLAQVDPGRDALTLHTSSQVPGIVRDALSELLGLPGAQLTVIAPDVGGGFGGKTSLYQEEVLVATLARKLSRTVKWTGDRFEDLISTSQAFDEIVDAELALDAEGAILGLRADVIGDVGAYSIYPWTAGIEPVQVVSFIPGPYRIPCYEGKVRCVCTPKSPTGPYRAVGRPTAAFVIERLIDLSARRLGIDPIEMRRRNLVRPDEFPYKAASGIVWDQANFLEELETAATRIDYAGFRERQKTAREQGRWLGIGIASYAELSGIGSKISASPGMPINTGTDTCVMSLDATGSITAAFGSSAHGQGHETTLGQIVADELGARLGDVRIINGDSSAVPYGVGSFASRTAVLSGGAAILSARELRQRMLRVAGHILDADPQYIEIEQSQFRAVASGKTLTFAELARDMYSQMGRVPPDQCEDLTVSKMYDPVVGTTSSSAHMAQVEVDPETLGVRILRYVVAEDCGRMINPLIVDGQLRGAVAQGVGAALLEEVIYDPQGQILTASLADYLVPTAPVVPNLDVVHLDTEAPNTLGGFRGMGEGGVIGSPAAIANAVSDALSHLGIEIHELPVTPERLFRLMEASRCINSNTEDLP